MLLFTISGLDRKIKKIFYRDVIMHNMRIVYIETLRIQIGKLAISLKGAI
jgi:hypothetical protein